MIACCCSFLVYIVGNIVTKTILHILISHIPQFSQRQFNDLFVWKWMECQNPKFLYNFDLFELYPQGLFPTAFFLWKHYLVLMPDTGYVRENQVFTSMIRVHDLNDNMKLVGSYDFPEQSSTRRYVICLFRKKITYF